MQNTMVGGERGGGEWPLEKNIKIDLGGKWNEGNKKLRKISLKDREKSLKNASFMVINFARLPQTYSSGEKGITKEGGGMIDMYNI